MKRVLALTAAAFGFVLIAGATAPAQAADCYYLVYQDGHGYISGIQGHSHAAKLKNACDRARRECNRRLDRAYRKGKLPRGCHCVRHFAR